MENQENHSNIANSEPTKPSSKFKPPTFGFVKSMPFFSLILIGATVSIGYFGVNLLAKNPADPNCKEDIFLPTASASLRLYCAQEAAKKQTLEDLIEAIELINVLPMDHPLRSELNRNLDQWTLDILKLGDNKYQEGKLDEALAIAEKVPTNIPNYTLVEKQIKHWKDTWKKAEYLFQLAENDLRESKWNKAYESALKLTNLRNKYWGKIKYDQIVDKLTIARDDSARLDQSYRLRRWGGVENLLEAIKLAKQVEKESYAYKEAQTLITTCGQKLLVIAEERLKVQDWSTALTIAKKIPPDSSLEERTNNVINLANALSKAAEGKVSSIQSAITLAQNIDKNSPFYPKAQKMIVSWEKEIEGVVHIQKAEELAKQGGIPQLQAAITEAKLVPNYNPRYSEAQGKIQGWTNQIQKIEDSPYLVQADQLANMGDITSLQAAITQANQIKQGRYLYVQAQNKMGQWNSKIQKIQDQPLIDQADSLANSGNLYAAIQIAQQVQPSRVLYQEARQKINIWQREIYAQNTLKKAYQLAESGQLNSITSAIKLAKQIPKSASVSNEAKELSNRWSYQILDLAQQQSASNLIQAISIAKNIPNDTEAYEAAQNQIKLWQNSLQPPVIPEIPPLPQTTSEYNPNSLPPLNPP